MKKILGLCVFILCTSAYSKEEKTKNDAIEEICGATADYAESVMNSRQNGVSLKEAIASINAKIPKGVMQDYYKAIAYEAYSQKKWESAEYKNSASIEFSNEILLSCTKTLGKELDKY